MGHALNPELIALDDLVAGRLASIIFHLVSQMRCGPGCCKYLAMLMDHLKPSQVPDTPSPPCLIFFQMLRTALLACRPSPGR